MLINKLYYLAITPKEIKPLEDRLCSRFEGGLLADVQAPDLETRIAYFKEKTLMDNLDVPLDVMTYIASISTIMFVN